MPLSAGRRLGPYEILAPIGAGGMGEVYRARDSRLDRQVAIKVLPDALAKDSERLARFEREAKVLASLNHSNIAQIYGVEENALVMELVEGDNLKGPLPVKTAINYASQIAQALEAAHDKGVVHRDLKPANIKITTSGIVKVLDFGLAAVAQSQASDTSDPEQSPTLTLAATHAGLIMGTAGYMSPEQAAGKPVDRRADIWSFGVVLWEMLTGRRLFDGETVSHTLAAVLTKDPNWSDLPSGTPLNLRRVLRRCLEREVKHRLRDMGDVWVELNTPDEFTSDSGPSPSRKPSFSERWLPWVAAGMVVAAAISWSFLRTPATQPRPVVHSAFTQEKLFGVPALSRDGTRLVYTELENAASHVVLRRLDQLEARPIPGAENAIYAVFSPDSQWLAYYGAGPGPASLMKIPVTGGAPITLCQCSAGSGISWGDNHTVIISDGKSLLRVSDTGGVPQSLTTPDQKKGELAHRSPFLLPGAKAVLFSIIGPGSSHQVAVLDLKKGGYHVIVSNGTSPQYNAAGYLTYVRSGTLLATPFDAQRLKPKGPETTVIQGISGVSSDAGEYSVSDNGVLVYMAGQNQGGKSTLGWIDRQGVQQQLSEPQLWGTGRLSPDGLRVVDSIRGDEDLADIWTFDVERRTLTRLTFGSSSSDPIWTPDARQVTYSSKRSGKNGIYSVPSDGSGKPELLMATEGRAVPCSWTPDGKKLIYSQAGSDKKSHLWTLGAAASGAASQPALLHDTSFAEFDAEISPDGRSLAYVSNESGAAEVYVQAFPGPGAKVRISTQGGLAPRWSRTGRELLYWLPSSYSLDRTALAAVDIQHTPIFHAGIPKELFKLRVGTTWDVAPDGKHFLAELLPKSADLHMETVVNWFDVLTGRVTAR